MPAWQDIPSEDSSIQGRIGAAPRLSGVSFLIVAGLPARPRKLDCLEKTTLSSTQTFISDSQWMNPPAFSPYASPNRRTNHVFTI
jgi:hypothetical protein